MGLSHSDPSGLERRGRLPRALVRFSVRYPRAVIGGWILVAVAAGAGISSLRIETSTDSVLDRSSESWSFYQFSQRTFGGDEILTLLIEGDTEFDQDALDAVAEESERFLGMEGVWRVDSLATTPLVHSTPSGALSLEPALSKAVQSESIDLRTLIRHDRIAPRTLISADEKAFAVNVVLDHGAEKYYPQVLTAMDDVSKRLGAWYSGVPVFRTETDSRTRTELIVFVPGTIIVVGVLLYFLFGSLRAVAIPLASSALGTWIMLGVMGALDVPITISTVVLPSVLLALGCAYSVHLLCAASCVDDVGTLEECLAQVALPIALSGLTTALGFIAISFVRIDAIRSIGGFGALGVILVLTATLTVGSAALAIWPLPPRRIRWRKWMEQTATPLIARLATHHWRPIVISWVGAVLLVSIGVSQLRIETDVIRWFSKDDPIRVAYNVIRDRLSGISPMNVVIQSESAIGVDDPAAIKAIDDLTAYAQSLPEVGRAVSIADPLRQIHGGFVEDESEPLPQDRGQIAQYLVLLESKSYTHDLITPDRSAANIMLRVNDNGSGALVGVGEKLEEWWSANGVSGFGARATGIMHEFGKAEDAIAYGQVRGLVFALIAITLILIAIFRWLGLALVALLPNAIPIAIGFGAMGLMGIPLDAGTVVIGNLAFGIAVDDSIHVVAAFIDRRRTNSNAVDCLTDAYRTVLPPLVFTTLAITSGFLVLALSDFTLIRHLGVLTAVLMLLCLMADVMLLPALLSRLGEPPKSLAQPGSTI